MTDQDYLIHYGVLGMKWGVRKDKRGGLPRARKLKKQIAKANRSPESNKNVIRVRKKIESEFNKTEEGKRINKYNKVLNSLHESLVKQTGNSNAAIVLSRAETLQYNDAVKKANSKYSEIGKKYSDEFLGAALKDLGYEDTQAGRDYLRKKKLVSV